MLEIEFRESLPNSVQARIRAIERLHIQLSSKFGFGTSVYQEFSEKAKQNFSNADEGRQTNAHITHLPPALSDLSYIIQHPLLKELLLPSEQIVVAPDSETKHLEPVEMSKVQVAARNLSIVLSRCGFDSPPATLEEIAQQHSLTRERVRQILMKQNATAYRGIASVPIQQIPVLYQVTMLLVAMASVEPHRGSGAAEQVSEAEAYDGLSAGAVLQIADYLVELHLISSRSQLIPILTWYQFLLFEIWNKVCSIWDPPWNSPSLKLADRHWIGKAMFGLSLRAADDPRAITLYISQAWKGLTAALNAPLPTYDDSAAQAIKMIKLRGAYEVTDHSLRRQIIEYLRQHDHQVLEVASWVVRLDSTRNTLRDGIARLLTMNGPLSLNHIRDGIAATKPGRKEYSLVIADSELESILQETNWCNFLNGKWHWAGGKVEVGKKDKAVFEALSALPRVFFYYEAIAATESICSSANINFFLKGPYGFSPKHNMYCLRGTEYNVFDLARKLPQGTVAHAKAAARFISHDPDVMHVEAPENWNSQVAVGFFYDGDWTIKHGALTRPGKARNGVLFSGLLPVLKTKQIGLCFDLNISADTRVIKVSKCSDNSHKVAKLERGSDDSQADHKPSLKVAGKAMQGPPHVRGSLAKPISRNRATEAQERSTTATSQALQAEGKAASRAQKGQVRPAPAPPMKALPTNPSTNRFAKLSTPRAIAPIKKRTSL